MCDTTRVRVYEEGANTTRVLTPAVHFPLASLSDRVVYGSLFGSWDYNFERSNSLLYISPVSGKPMSVFGVWRLVKRLEFHSAGCAAQFSLGIIH